MENTITITLKEYKNLMLMSAKTAIIKEMVAKGKYVSTADLKMIMDIEETEKENGYETV
jgi:hypothetical protein